MKKNKIVIPLLAFFLVWQPLIACAANLLDVYQQAQWSDPTFQQVVAQRLATKEGVPISVAALLPSISFGINPTVTRTGYSGSNFDPVMTNSGTYVNPRNLTERTYSMNLTLNQTIFDFAQFSTVAQQWSLSNGADATLNAALQNLMVRVANAYFAILQAEDNVRYAQASKLAFAEQLDQIKRQFKVGLKTITDVYTAQASYDSAVATAISAQTTLANDKENLRVITGVYYPRLAALSENFPLITPRPQNMAAWVKTAVVQNWAIKASQYNVSAARAVIKENFAGHLPTLDLQTNFQRDYDLNINRYASFSERNGPGTTSDRSLTFSLNVPIFSGGGVVAQTNQAVYRYQAAQQQLEQTMRDTMNTTRQSYLNIVAGISQISADKQTIKSTMSSLAGLQASYAVGTETLVDVLNQRQKVYQAQTQYAKDRYAFVNDVLALKEAAGTLSVNDLRAINTWLVNS